VKVLPFLALQFYCLGGKVPYKKNPKKEEKDYDEVFEIISLLKLIEFSLILSS
jgi:hypothetical protein